MLRKICVALCAVTVLACLAGAEVLRFEPGPVASFDVMVPQTARAGEPTTIRITARDEQGNIVTNYSATGAGIALAVVPAVDAAPEVEPSRFAASGFRNGILEAPVVFRRARAVSLDVRDLGRSAAGRSEKIEVVPGAVAKILVEAPTEARVGEAFDVSIVVLDRLDNPVVDFDRNGVELALVSGMPGTSGRFEPAKLAPSFFVQGRATFKVRYSAAERTQIEARVGAVAGRSNPIAVRAGRLASVDLAAPPSAVRAGEPFSLTLTAKDRNGNVIQDFHAHGEIIELVSTGTSDVSPSTVAPSSFTNGVATIAVRYTRAEPIRILARDRSGAKLGETPGEVRVTGGRLGNLEVVVAEDARAGEPLALQIFGTDAYGNSVGDLSGQSLQLDVRALDGAPLEGPATPITAANFRQGSAFFTVKPIRAGALMVQVTDRVTGASGRSNAVMVRAGKPGEFVVASPADAVANEPFTVEIEARDRFGNVLRDYSRIGSPLIVQKTGRGMIIPEVIPASAFVDGRARVSFTYNVAEELTIVVTEQGGTASGRAAPLHVRNAEPAVFEISGPQTAVAGEAARVRIVARDDFGNPVVGYSGSNAQIALFTENGLPVAPPFITAAAFRQGVAELDVVFIRSGAARLVAEEVLGRVGGLSEEIRVVPGRPAQLVVSGPERVKAGDPFIVRIEMRDRLGNRLLDYSPSATSLSARIVPEGGPMGSSDVDLRGFSAMVFRAGVAELELRGTRTGAFRVEVRDELQKVYGQSGRVAIHAGAVADFRVEAPGAEVLRAGDPIKLRVTAVDEFGNIVEDYGSKGRGVSLRAYASSGAAPLSPATGALLPTHIGGELFHSGVAVFYAIYDKAEAVTIKAEALASGAVLRPEVFAVVKNDGSPGGSSLSVIANGPIHADAGQRLAPSLLEVTIAGAKMSSSAPGVTKLSGLVSMVSMADLEKGVRILVHATEPASMRVAPEANRVLIDVDRVVAGAGAPPVLVLDPVPVVRPAPQIIVPQGSTPVPSTVTAPGASGMGALDAALRAGRHAEALRIVDGLLETSPSDPALLSLRRRLEALSAIQIVPYLPTPAVPAAPAVPEARPTPAAPAEKANIPALQPQEDRVETPAGPPGISTAEGAIRAGRYQEALELLNRYLEERPQDSEAKKMKLRVEQLLQILRGSGATPGNER